jgi:4-aminobutyrate aminotransferase-like enzyme
MKAKETPPSVPGPESRRLFAEEQRLIAPGLQRIALMSELTLASGRGATVEDADGNRYVDFFAGVAVASLGHSHPHWVARMEAQIRSKRRSASPNRTLRNTRSSASGAAFTARRRV